MANILIRAIRKVRRSDWIDALRAEIARNAADAERQLGLVHEQLARREKDHADLSRSRDSEISQLKQSLAERRDVAEELVRRLDAAQAQLDTANERVGTALSERDQALAEAFRQSESVGHLASTFEALSARAASELSALQSELAIQKARAEADLVEARERASSLENAVAEAATRIDALLIERDSLLAECARLGASETELIAERQSLLAAVERNGNVREPETPLACATPSIAVRQEPIAKTSGRRFFVTTSLGRTATQWLTGTLNRHAQILATHALDLSPSKRPVASQGNDFIASLDRQDWTRTKFVSLDDAFDFFDNHEFRVVGNIHGLDALEAAQQPERFKRRYYGSYMTRHPVPRLKSLVSRWKYENNLSERRRLANLDAFRALGDRFDGLMRKYGVTPSENDQLFLLALNYLLPEEARYLRSDLPIVVYERLVREPDYLLWHLTEISDGQIDFSDEFVDSAIDQDAVDQRTGAPNLARRDYHAWSSWQKEAFAGVLEEAGTEDVYSRLGYETFFP